jgi:WD40 repeat protein
VFSINSHNLLFSVPNDLSINCITLCNRNREYICVGNKNGQIDFWDLHKYNEQLLHHLNGPNDNSDISPNIILDAEASKILKTDFLSIDYLQLTSDAKTLYKYFTAKSGQSSL